VTDNKSNRRDFLATTFTLAGGGWLAVNAPMVLAAGEAAAGQREAGEPWAQLSGSEARCLTAVVDQIIPPDDLPGASEAGVVYFIDQALGGFMAAQAGVLRAGLAELDARVQAESPGVPGFADLPFEQQTSMLQPIDTTPFFSLAIFLTHCGMFAMPSWGGNRDRAGWKLLGFDDRHAWQPPFGFYDAEAGAAEDSHVRG